MTKKTKKLLKGAIPKTQQVYNKFLFDEHCEIHHSVELAMGCINELKVCNEATRGSFASLFPRVEKLCEKVESIENKTSLESKTMKTQIFNLARDYNIMTARKYVTESDFQSTVNTVRDLAARIEDRSDDYHMHIRALREDEIAKHQAEILMMQEQIKGLETRLSRAQDMIAECHPEGCIVVKNKKKPVGKVQG